MCDSKKFTNAWEAVEALRKADVFFDELANFLVAGNSRELMAVIRDNIRAARLTTEVILECSTEGRELQSLACFLRK